MGDERGGLRLFALARSLSFFVRSACRSCRCGRRDAPARVYHGEGLGEPRVRVAAELLRGPDEVPRHEVVGVGAHERAKEGRGLAHLALLEDLGAHKWTQDYYKKN